MDTMNPVPSKPLSQKPIAGLCVILFVVTIIGGWLYVDSVRGELEMRMQAFSQRAEPTSAKEQVLPAANPSRFVYKGLSFEIPSEWSVDRTGSDGDAVFMDRSGAIVAELDCRAERAISASEFTKLVAERTTDPDNTKAQLFRHQALGDSDVPPSWTLQMEYMSAANPCRLAADAGAVAQGVMERAFQSLRMTELY